jgi:hypothetical protein
LTPTQTRVIIMSSVLKMALSMWRIKMVNAFPSGFDPGMELRDYFAAMAMAAIRGHHDHYAESVLAKEAYSIADAMMVERSKENS